MMAKNRRRVRPGTFLLDGDGVYEVMWISDGRATVREVEISPDGSYEPVGYNIQLTQAELKNKEVW